MNKRTKSILTRSFCLLITATTFWIIISRIEPDRFWDLLRGLNIPLYIAGVALVPAAVLIQAYRWKLCIDDIFRIPYSVLLRLTTISYFFNNFFLSFIGGDIFRAFSIAKPLGKIRAAFTLFLVRATNIWGAAMIPAPFYLLYRSFFLSSRAFLVTFLISITAWVCIFLVPLVSRLRPEWIRRFPNKITTIDLEYAFKPRRLTALMVSSITFQVVNILIVYLYAQSLRIEIGLVELCLVVPGVAVITSLPISINGIGIREGSFVLALGFFGISPEKAFALSLLTYTGSIYVSIVGGCIFLFHKLVGREGHLVPNK